MNGVRSRRKIAKEQSCHLNDRDDVVVATFNMLCLPYLYDELDTCNSQQFSEKFTLISDDVRVSKEIGFKASLIYTSLSFIK